MKYKGYELLKAIANGEIKEGTEIFVTTSLDGRYINTSRAYIGHNDIYWKDTNKQLPAYVFITGEFELIEYEIDIDNIENINAYELPENEEDFRQMAELCRLQYHKNTEFIDAIKQLNKEIKSIKEK